MGSVTFIADTTKQSSHNINQPFPKPIRNETKFFMHPKCWVYKFSFLMSRTWEWIGQHKIVGLMVFMVIVMVFIVIIVFIMVIIVIKVIIMFPWLSWLSRWAQVGITKYVGLISGSRLRLCRISFGHQCNRFHRVSPSTADDPEQVL